MTKILVLDLTKILVKDLDLSKKSYLQWVDQLKMSSLFDQDDGCIPSLTWTQRWYGFCACFVIGNLTSLLSSISLTKGDIPAFALLYTLGNVISICSTGVVWGPKRQCKKMFHNVRVIATSMYLICIVATLIFATTDLAPTKTAKVGICIFLIVLQFIALCWYCLSYIPYARTIAKQCLPF